ncbi:MAG: hypothetical protein A2381_00245 [Bdellovibrionales bacterium RIFOXYB1_FULL_37_110]|nr:MAG: hypothetical protein A2417_11300 [Bdellovibrionales bacterium RIFOXYC1_FULL_37_79]OFZ60824.1 MAG: hypothetical protein A2381_00245 [Bdellovibrionales bacterium RIFOXYB1_FULL_37_110]OFZ62354.1 MAG: hypothetical protein A2577_02910 [Bdellovibrionales bacterium RIFOXYD1_FULL_36_51]
MSPKDYKTAQIYLERIIEHINKIRKYKKGLSLKKFKEQDQEYDAICMQLSQIGENVSKIEISMDKIIEKFPSAVNWKALKGLRNKIDHDYTWLETDKIWVMLENDFDDLESGVKNILKKRYGLKK